MASKFGQEWLALGHAGENQGTKLEVEAMEEILWWAAENKWFEYPPWFHSVVLPFPL
jgi:hypothetical protein